MRNEQLSNLLRDAGITVPSVCGTIKKFKKKPLWSGKISPEQAELQKNEMESKEYNFLFSLKYHEISAFWWKSFLLEENIVSVQHRKKKKLKAATSGSTAKDESIVINGVEQKPKARRNRKKKGVPAPNCYIVLSQTAPFRSNSTQQYYLITNPANSNILRSAIKPGEQNYYIIFLKNCHLYRCVIPGIAQMVWRLQPQKKNVETKKFLIIIALNEKYIFLISLWQKFYIYFRIY